MSCGRVVQARAEESVRLQIRPESRWAHLAKASLSLIKQDPESNWGRRATAEGRLQSNSALTH